MSDERIACEAANCEKTFKNKESLRKHVARFHLVNESFQCPRCGVTESRGESQHRRFCTKLDEIIKCKDCPSRQAFPTLNALYKHRQRKQCKENAKKRAAIASSAVPAEEDKKKTPTTHFAFTFSPPMQPFVTPNMVSCNASHLFAMPCSPFLNRHKAALQRLIDRQLHWKISVHLRMS